MKLFIATFAAVLLASAGTARAQTEKKSPPKGTPVSLNAQDLKWGDAPADLPKGAMMVVLYGDPTKKGTYALRLKMPDGYRIPPHWHTQDEQLTILSGTFVLHMGDTMDAPAQQLTTGGFHFLPGKMHHAAEAKGETIVQLNGMGPFDIHYLNPADNPKKTAEK
jgi:hypothetical protein